MMDRDGDAANNGTGFGKPAKDLSINYVPVPYPDYPPAVIQMKPGERQLWRVLNASAITYLNLEVLFGHTPQPLGSGGYGWRAHRTRVGEWKSRRRREPADASRHSAGSARGIYRARASCGRDRPAGDPDRGHRAGGRKRYQPHAGKNRRHPRRARAPLQVVRVRRSRFLRPARGGWAMWRRCVCGGCISQKSWPTRMIRPAPSSSI